MSASLDFKNNVRWTIFCSEGLVEGRDNMESLAIKDRIKDRRIRK
jgi:hypothetical protein